MNLIKQFEKESGMKYPKHDMPAQANFDELYEEWLENLIPEWIDVNEELPEKTGFVLIHNSELGIGVTSFDIHTKLFNTSSGKVTHWMKRECLRKLLDMKIREDKTK